MTSFRVYGPSGAHDSLSRIAGGMMTGLRESGRDVSFFDLASVLDDDDGLTEGYDADIGVYVGPLSYLSVMARRGQHKQRLVWIFPNSSWVPPEFMVDAARSCTAILTGTSWGAAVLREQSLGLPVMRWKLGVDAAFGPSPGEVILRKSGAVQVLHLSSTRMGRKGTDKLIAAWALAQSKQWISQSAELHLVLTGDEGLARRQVEQESNHFSVEARVVFHPRLNLPPDKMAAFYRGYEMLCQPSRAEGFGLCPLEARACGVSVCVTACTGHAEHIHKGQPGVVVIDHGPDAPIDDGPGAMAPTVGVSDVAEALRSWYAHRDEIELWAQRGISIVRSVWSWERVTEEFMCNELGE